MEPLDKFIGEAAIIDASGKISIYIRGGFF
jgi:hypothetical protein